MPYRGRTSPVLRATLRPILDDPGYRFRTRADRIVERRVRAV